MICERMHWNWDYLHHGIPFNTVQKIMIDLPQYDYEDDEEGNDNAPDEIKEQSAADFAKMMNNFTL